MRRDMIQEDRVRQVVIQHHVSLLKTLLPANGQELLVTRSSADQIDFSYCSHDKVQA